MVTLSNEVSPWLKILQVVPDGWNLPSFAPGQYTTQGLYGCPLSNEYCLLFVIDLWRRWKSSTNPTERASCKAREAEPVGQRTENAIVLLLDQGVSTANPGTTRRVRSTISCKQRYEKDGVLDWPRPPGHRRRTDPAVRAKVLAKTRLAIGQLHELVVAQDRIE